MSTATGETDELQETPDLHGAYPRLDASQTAELERVGTRRTVQPGEVLYRQGDMNCDLFVVLEGLVAVLDEQRPDPPLAVHGPGRIVGELGMLTGTAVLLTAVVQRPGAVLAVPHTGLKEVVNEDPTLGDLILRALFVRRSLQMGLGAGLRVLGSRYSPDTRRLREFLARNRVAYRWIDLETDGEAESLLRQLGIRPEETPVVIWRGQTVLRNPSTAQLARVLGLRRVKRAVRVRDLVVVGAGPAGLAAAVYGASEGLETFVVDGTATGGQSATASRIENYLGFPAGISGAELADRAVIQARKFGADITLPMTAMSLDRDDGLHLVTVDGEESVRCRVVLIATGVRYRKLDVPGIEAVESASVYYAATEMEAVMCRDDPIVVVGGGNSAGQAAVFLSDHASKVHLVTRNADLEQEMSRYLADRIARLRNVDVHPVSEVAEVTGEKELEAVVVQNSVTDQQEVLPARALFVFIGNQPHVQWLGDCVALDEGGFVRTGLDASAARDGQEDEFPPLMLETTRPGVFAAGDVRSGSVKRVAAAVGEGALAVRLIHQYLARTGGSRA
jgi:thioredoxin reductase (NADPH)